MADRLSIIALYKLTDIDFSAIKSIIGPCEKTMFFEEGMENGGVALSFAKYMNCSVYAVNSFVKQGTVEEQYRMTGLDARSILEIFDGK